MKYLLLLALYGFSFCASAAGFCERLPVDPEFPAGLGGTYEVIGQDAGSGKSYSGMLAIGYGKNAYTLSRTIKGRTVHGKAWLDRCSADKIMQLTVRYETTPATEAVCFLSTDSDNYFRTSCRTWLPKHKRSGLEAWFQKP
jgi:hypothetical protein